MKSRQRLVGIYIAGVALAATVAFIASTRSNGLFACQSVDESQEFIAYCNARNYADFDHGAFYFELRPDTAAAAANANVLFIGNSRMQFAFSTESVRHLFESMSLSYYLLGFSHGENQAFLGRILEILSPSADVYVISVDDFFEPELTDPARDVLTNPDARNRYRQKKQWQKLHSAICSPLPSLCGHQYAYIRSVNDGQWRFEGDDFLNQNPSRATPVGNTYGIDEDKLDMYTPVAESFVSGLRSTGACILFTNVPSSSVSNETARQLATNLKVPYVGTNVDGLMTFDGSHLDRSSAERWTRALSAELRKAIAACVRQTR
jgi:hypothetical protein